MNITDFVNSLTLNELEYTQHLINNRIASINEEPKAEIYIVSDGESQVGCYTEDEFHKAKEHLVKIISSDDYTSDSVSEHFSECPTIIKIKVSQSEAKEYLELYK